MAGRAYWWVAGAVLALVAAGALLAFWRLGGGPDFGGPLSPRAFTLGGERFTIDLPEPAAIAEDEGGAFAWIELKPGGRTSPSIWLETPYDDTQPFAYDQHAQWSGGRLDYRLAVNAESAGSGGPEGNLDGRLAFAERLWSVSCKWQREGIVAEEADWCLPLLKSLEHSPE